MKRRLLAAGLALTASLAATACAGKAEPTSLHPATPSSTPSTSTTPTASLPVGDAVTTPAVTSTTAANPGPNPAPPANPGSTSTSPANPPPSTTIGPPSGPSGQDQQACQAAGLAVAGTFTIVWQLAVIDDPDASAEEQAAARQEMINKYNVAAAGLASARDVATSPALKAALTNMMNVMYSLAALAATATADDMLNAIGEGSAYEAGINQIGAQCP